MTGNRVEELEGEVQELRATVSGLTDELVETKERLRLIEDHFGPELDDIINGSVTRTEARAELSGQAQQPNQRQPPVDEEPEPAADAEPASDQTAASDEESADEAKADEEESEEETTGSDDIIVA